MDKMPIDDELQDAVEIIADSGRSADSSEQIIFGLIESHVNCITEQLLGDDSADYSDLVEIAEDPDLTIAEYREQQQPDDLPEITRSSGGFDSWMPENE